MDAIIGAVAAVIGTLLSGRFVLDRPARRRKEIAELLALQAQTPAPAQAELTSLIARKWVLLLVPRPWTRRLLLVVGVLALLTAACSFTGAGFARATRLHTAQAASDVTQSDRLSNASTRDSISSSEQLVKLLPDLRSEDSVPGRKQLLSELHRSLLEGHQSNAAYDRARLAGRAAASDAATANDLAHTALGLLVLGVAALLVLVEAGRRELNDLAPRARKLEAQLQTQNAATDA